MVINEYLLRAMVFIANIVRKKVNSYELSESYIRHYLEPLVNIKIIDD